MELNKTEDKAKRLEMRVERYKSMQILDNGHMVKIADPYSNGNQIMLVMLLNYASVIMLVIYLNALHLAPYHLV